MKQSDGHSTLGQRRPFSVTSGVTASRWSPEMRAGFQGGRRVSAPQPGCSVAPPCSEGRWARSPGCTGPSAVHCPPLRGTRWVGGQTAAPPSRGREKQGEGRNPWWDTRSHTPLRALPFHDDGHHVSGGGYASLLEGKSEKLGRDPGAGPTDPEEPSDLLRPSLLSPAQARCVRSPYRLSLVTSQQSGGGCTNLKRAPQASRDSEPSQAFGPEDVATASQLVTAQSLGC